MIIGTIVISEPNIPSEFDLAQRSLFIMGVSIQRMKHMIEFGYYCNEYSEDEWEKFKKYKKL